MNKRMSCGRTLLLRRSLGLATGLGLALALPLAMAGTTLDFDALPAGPPANGSAYLVDANAASRTISGITFNAADNSDWEIYGNAFQAGGPDTFADSHSGSDVLAGNAFSGSDIFGTAYTGLTISTTLSLTRLYVGFDDDGFGSNDADSLTITAFGSSGDLGATTVALTSKTLSLLDTSATFAALSGITGYRFETTSADDLDAAYGRAYLIADDLSFDAGLAPVPEPSTWASLVLGLFALGTCSRRRRPASVRARRGRTTLPDPTLEALK